MPEISKSRTQVQETKEKYNTSRLKVLQADDQWAEADNNLKEKKVALDGLKLQLAEASKAAAKAKAAAQKAAAAATAAEKAVQSLQ
jgi:hypothetical protein